MFSLDFIYTKYDTRTFLLMRQQKLKVKKRGERPLLFCVVDFYLIHCVKMKENLSASTYVFLFAYLSYELESVMWEIEEKKKRRVDAEMRQLCCFLDFVPTKSFCSPALNINTLPI